MNLTDALAKATANGWADDSRWTPSHVSAQVSTEREGFLASVTVRTTGAINWNVLSTTGEVKSQRGFAATVEAALDACESAVRTATGTLF